MTLRTPTQKEFLQTCSSIKEFELDDRNLLREQFTVAVRKRELLGFGRLLSHTGCVELCSLGVLSSYRRKGIGRAIVKELIRRANQKLYLVCIIPDYFVPLGFEIVEALPEPIIKKILYCTQELVVPENYVAMRFQEAFVPQSKGVSY